MNKSKLIFYSGVKTVTGSNFMLKTKNNTILIDCGLIQGEGICDKMDCLSFQYDPSKVDVLLVTHSHIDHIGRVPKLVRDGFQGKIYSTPETKEMAKIMLNDALKFIEEEANDDKNKQIYTKEDIKNALSLWQTLDYHKTIELNDKLSFSFKDAGHILGSAIVEFEREGKKLVFSGDLGNSPSPLLRSTEAVTDANYLVVESVYGDREHEDSIDRKLKLEKAVKDIISKNGTLVIPAFSVSRTQMMLFELNELIENNKVKSIPVFLDSPLAIKITEVYRKHQKDFNKEARDLIAGGDKIFNFPKLKFTETVEASKTIADVKGAKIIIAGSGMSTGGRVIHHEKRYLSDERNILLIVGYQAPGSLGRLIQGGAKEVVIQGAKIPIMAEVRTITGYSGHKGSDELLQFVSRSQKTLKEVFVVMGELKSSLFFVQKIRDNLGVKALNPEVAKEYEINF